ncbi:hypothetical protein M8818_000248 [Zalaria obscura]|uniref:Uncharacterized protein n=1 Tax=Zalaria obscura TaxID=2024903 RepID=A0ACC3SP25_9PEZI
MASIFTWEPEIQRVASPWMKAGGKDLTGADSNHTETQRTDVQSSSRPLPEATSVTRLEAEPQEGPVEYKLHLLLRPRRRFLSANTKGQASGSQRTQSNGPQYRSPSENALNNASATSSASSQQLRQHRLEQLTTQLLWRLQQSSPHHTSSSTNIILPSLPEALPELPNPRQPAKLLHGLEESQGALYEIGVSDDGTFVGLAEDEMQESLTNLNAMAASLGCVVDVLRMVTVGQCEWMEDSTDGKEVKQRSRSGKLLVAEAFVKPQLRSIQTSPQALPIRANGHTKLARQSVTGPYTEQGSPACGELTSMATTQLRVTLTGATMSGKSSLLGTLTTSTLDNGRGKSRLSMLKHRHEITSGITSSVTQELVGYQSSSCGGLEVINYANRNIASWVDMHAAVSGGRLVFVSDSAGHPRYRRTTVRGLVGWDPHWTALCIPADDAEETPKRTGSPASSKESVETGVTDVDLSAAHLDLCMRLGLPLVVVITKLDIASKTGLRLTLAKLLSTLKAAGRAPIMIPNTQNSVSEDDLNAVPARVCTEMVRVLDILKSDPCKAVPIIMTSAVDGRGVESMHAVLRQLPIPAGDVTGPPNSLAGPNTVFNIDDVYSRVTDSYLTVVSGLLHRGTLSIGDEVYIGPCSAGNDDSDDSDGLSLHRPSALQTSRSFPGALRARGTLAARLAEKRESRRVKIASIRNLRLPVSTLHSNQVGTLGLTFVDDEEQQLKIRKGMVVADVRPKAISTVVAWFRREDLGSLAVGSHVVAYLASIRASARIISARAPDPSEMVHIRKSLADTDKLSEAVHEAAGGMEPVAGVVTHHFLLVALHFDASREYVELGSKILVMPGGGPSLYGGTERGEKGVAGLEGFVGRVTEVCD